MGNTDISVNTLPDANTENTTEHSTIFDDVFRTIAQKMPQLLILQFTASSGRHSVLERPFSEANGRPFVS